MNPLVLIAIVVSISDVLSVGAAFAGGRKVELPEANLCAERVIHQTSPLGSNYFFSWRDPSIVESDWLDARNYCRMRCMDTVSLETLDENEYVKSIIINENINSSWTSGRICDFTGCEEREDLSPLHLNGWFWTAVYKSMPPSNQRELNDWSHTGPTGEPQPDTRDPIFWQTDNCLAYLNNYYGDGLKWHDVKCQKRRPFICEDSAELLRWIRHTNPELNVK